MTVPFSAFSARRKTRKTNALLCGSIVVGIVSHIDLNTLDALARSSRVIHDGLIQYRTSLMGATLRCSKEAVPVDPEQTLRYRARASDWNYMDDGRSYSGKSGSCARDMVAECRRCADIICRVSKPPLFPSAPVLEQTADIGRPELCHQAASCDGSARATPPALCHLCQGPHCGARIAGLGHVVASALGCRAASSVPVRHRGRLAVPAVRP